MAKRVVAQHLLDTYPTEIMVVPLKRGKGFNVYWSVRGAGNGTLTFKINEQTKQFEIEDDCADKSFCKEMLSHLVDQAKII